jgi:hypothetical protein
VGDFRRGLKLELGNGIQRIFPVGANLVFALNADRRTQGSPLQKSPLIANCDLCESLFIVILNGAQLRCESRFPAPSHSNLGGIIEKPGLCSQKPDSSVAPLPQNDKGGDYRNGLSLGTQFSGE